MLLVNLSVSCKTLMLNVSVKCSLTPSLQLPVQYINVALHLCSSLCLSRSCFIVKMPSCTKQHHTWLTGLHRALTSTPSNIFGMNWNADCESDLITNISVGPHWCSGVWMGANPCCRFQHVVERPGKRIRCSAITHGWMFWCPHSFGHLVSVSLHYIHLSWGGWKNYNSYISSSTFRTLQTTAESLYIWQVELADCSLQPRWYYNLLSCHVTGNVNYSQVFKI